MPKGPPVIHSYDSMQAFTESLANPYQWDNRQSMNDDPDRAKWAGTPNMKAAERLLANGWPEGRERLDRAMASAATVRQRSPHRALGLDVAGAFPDVPAYVSGSPACMVTIADEERTTRPIIRFEISISASAMIEPGTITTRAAAILSWIDFLEETGARCEVVVIVGQLTRGERLYGFRMTLKRADEPLEIDRAAFVLMHPSFYRRIVFSWMERNIPKSDECGFYGMPHSVPVDPAAGQTIQFDKMLSSEEWANPAKAYQSVLAKIKAGGVDTHEEAA